MDHGWRESTHDRNALPIKKRPPRKEQREWKTGCECVSETFCNTWTHLFWGHRKPPLQHHCISLDRRRHIMIAPQPSNPHMQRRQGKARQGSKASKNSPSDGSFLCSVVPAPQSRPNSVIFFTHVQGYDHPPPALLHLTRAQSFVSYLFLLFSHHTANLISSPQFLPIIPGRQTPIWREPWMRVCHPSLPCCM